MITGVVQPKCFNTECKSATCARQRSISESYIYLLSLIPLINDITVYILSRQQSTEEERTYQVQAIKTHASIKGLNSLCSIAFQYCRYFIVWDFIENSQGNQLPKLFMSLLTDNGACMNNTPLPCLPNLCYTYNLPVVIPKHNVFM